jgi:hypothetical protein
VHTGQDNLFWKMGTFEADGYGTGWLQRFLVESLRFAGGLYNRTHSSPYTLSSRLARSGLEVRQVADYGRSGVSQKLLSAWCGEPARLSQLSKRRSMVTSHPNPDFRRALLDEKLTELAL